ncbi:MAG: hypothetical protein HY016_09020 [Nitrosomonadales bacterium]|nr:hypothetical protein [Nitrosomonadales bacterium]
MPVNQFDSNAFFPEVFCLVGISYASGKNGGYDYRATLYHDCAAATVSFHAGQRDARLKKGAFVSVTWLPENNSERGAVQVAGLVVRDCAADGFNPFLNMPPDWCAERHSVECARDLWDVSPVPLRKLLFANFWSGLLVKRGVGMRRLCMQ